AERFLEALDPSMRDRDALAEPGRAQLFARKQAIEDHAAADAVVVLEQQSGLLEQALFARRLQVEQHVGGGEELADQAHGSPILPSPKRAFRSACPCSAAPADRACRRGGRWR